MELWKALLCADRADGVTELGFGSALNRGFDVLPESCVVADVLAMGAYRDDAMQRLDLLCGIDKIELRDHRRRYSREAKRPSLR